MKKQFVVPVLREEAALAQMTLGVGCQVSVCFDNNF